MKFCKDCKHLWGGNMCKSPKLGRDIVTGRVNQVSAEGIRNMESKCGQAGYWFDPKPVTKLSEVLAWLKQWSQHGR